jgi:hypothetical protein
MTLTLLQSMRVHTDFEDFTLIGSQYKNELEIREWHIAMWSERDNHVRRHWVVAGQPPKDLVGEDLKAVKAATSTWEVKPVWVQSPIGC